MPEHDMVLMNDWDQIESQLEEGKARGLSSGHGSIADPERKSRTLLPMRLMTTSAFAPVELLRFGLNNDSDADGDV